MFSGEEGNKLDRTTINSDLKRRAELVGVSKRVYNHILRHSYATTMLENGIDYSDVSRLLGHKNISSTMTYKHSLIQHYVRLIYAHPLLAPELTLEMIEEQAVEYIEKLVKMSQYNKIIEKDEKRGKRVYNLANGELVITLKHKT